MTDPLARWWVHDVTVRRYLGPDVENADRFADPETVTGFYRDGSHLVTTSGGDEAVASGRFTYPSSVATIPARSVLTLPAPFAGDVVVMDTAVADAGPMPTPNHKTAEVK